MFEKFTRKITKQVIDQAKDVVSEEVQESLDSKLPMILGLLTMGVVLFITREPKQAIQNITIIHNYYR